MVGAPNPAPVSAQAVIIPGYYNDGCAMKQTAEPVDERVGARIKVGNDIGTIKYVGEVFGHQGLWFGVEWDEPERGRHSGVVSDIQYFTTSKPGAGSFVRPNKVAPYQTCAEAIQKQYAYKEDELTSPHLKCALNEVKREIGAPFIEMVGFEKLYSQQGNLDVLEEAYIPDQNVSAAGPIGRVCPNLRVLDVSRNLFRGWREVVSIAAQLPNLRDLNVSKNRLSMDVKDSETVGLGSLRRLNMSHCAVGWSDVLQLSRMWPRLEELVLACNKVTSIPRATGLMEGLRLLKLDGNPIESWSQVLNLTTFRNLEVLSLNECGLTEIRFDEKNVFENLEVLLLNRNCISDWRSIAEVDKLPKLKRLYLLKNPIHSAQDYDTAAQMIIARIGSLQELNGSVITAQARRGAEYDYLKKHGAEYKNGDEMFNVTHPRFRSLVDKYGIPEDSLLTTQPKHTSLTSKLLEIHLVSPDGEKITKKFPSNMMVQKLVSMAQRLLGKDKCCQPKLFCVDEENRREIELDNVMKDLNYFSVRDGDTVLVKWN